MLCEYYRSLDEVSRRNNLVSSPWVWLQLNIELLEILLGVFCHILGQRKFLSVQKLGPDDGWTMATSQ